MVIQRMTSLAGLFVLSGLATFVWAHLIANARPRLATAFLLAGLGLATLFATLSKENGALLPLLALTILWTWIPKERRLTASRDRALLVLFAAAPTVLLVIYLGNQFLGIFDHGYGPLRYFTPAQRLLSQPAILLDYVQNLLFPRAINASPYMDWIPAPKGILDTAHNFNRDSGVVRPDCPRDCVSQGCASPSLAWLSSLSVISSNRAFSASSSILATEITCPPLGSISRWYSR